MPLSVSNHARYDDHDRVLTVKNPLNNTTSYVYDGFGDRIQEASPDSGTAVYTFNADGDLTKQVLAGPLEADMTYDADDRLTATTYPSDSTLNTALTYDQAGHGDGIGRLTSATDKIGSLSLTYDERGNVTYESRVATGITTLNTTYAFDAGNNVSGIAYPSGTMVTYGRDIMGRVTSVSAQPPGFGSPSTIAGSIAYEPFGPVTGLTYGNSIVGTYQYDADYRPTSRVDAGTATIQNLSYAYYANDSVQTITDAVNAANTQSMTYDALDRITGATSGTGGYGTYSWTWDKAHNVATQVINGTTTTINKTSGTNKLSNWVTSGVTTTVTNTSAGNINLLKNGATTIETLTYNAANELVSASASGGSASYAYDFLGRRLEKLPSGGNTIVLQYAGFSKLLSEDDLHGNAADYIYLGGRPIGEVNPGTGALYYTHTDKSGTPQYLTNGSQTVVWAATYKPYGNAQTISGSIIQHLRSPGQYYDSETGYHSNGFRVLDPNEAGRYISPDPLGLDGGINTFQYAENNPFKYIDPLGLWSFTPETEELALERAGEAEIIGGGPEDPAADIVAAFAAAATFAFGSDALIADAPAAQAGGGGGGNKPPPAATTGGGSDCPKRGIGGSGWRGDKAWRDAVNLVRKGGTIESFKGTIPTLEEAQSLLDEAGVNPNNTRIDTPHEPPNPHNYPHINYETPSGGKGTIRIQ